MSVSAAIVALAGLAALPVVSYLVEALRSQRAAPRDLPWAPEIPVQWIEIGGTKLRYIMAGSGPPLVLLHTLRTQLDMFQKVIPVLAERFRVYAVDYPGHGYSDIPDREYSPELFVAAVAGFLDALALEEAVIVGESIGGTVGLLLAARHHKRVRAVVAVNPYDYDAGRGLRRSSLLANVMFGLNNVPILGATVMRLRSYPVEKLVFEGGLRRKSSLPPRLAHELHEVGERRGHYRAFMSLVRHWPEWERARLEYGGIDRPVLLLYGDHDWSRDTEREANRGGIPGARMKIVPEAGHFLSLDDPGELTRSIVEFTDGLKAAEKTAGRQSSSSTTAPSN
jgi:pimeloyl-ACP methyl ester carboxylesterase